MTLVTMCWLAFKLAFWTWLSLIINFRDLGLF
jgi:hypothetical protein